MVRFLQVSALLLLLTTLIPALGVSASGLPALASQEAGIETAKPLCLPDVYLADPVDCLAMGPAGKLTAMARKGLSFPARPLPAVVVDAALVESPVQIARINLEETERAALYSSFEDAISGQNAVGYIDPGYLRYVSYINVAYHNDNPYLQLRSGAWIRASPVSYSSFRGLVFERTPANSFGWIFDHAEVRVAPGYSSPLLDETLLRESSVQIYDMQPADGTDWYQVGIDRWVERRYIRQLRLRSEPPEGVDNNRWIDINLYDQTMGVYEDGQLVFATMIATGVEPFYTRPGLFKVERKLETETMSGAFEADRSDYYYLEDVPWTMYFDGARATHAAYWRAWFGIPQSHGCVNMSLADSHWLFNWAQEGDWVYVWDPSGETPTDPKLYGAGGA